MSEWALLFISLPIFIGIFAHFYKSFQNVNFLRRLKLYLPVFYLLIIFIAIVGHLIFPAQIIGEGKIKFSVGMTIVIIFSFPGFFVMQSIEKFGLMGLFEGLNTVFGLFVVIVVNFVVYWIASFIFEFLYYSWILLFKFLNRTQYYLQLKDKWRKLSSYRNALLWGFAANAILVLLEFISGNYGDLVQLYYYGSAQQILSGSYLYLLVSSGIFTGIYYLRGFKINTRFIIILLFNILGFYLFIFARVLPWLLTIFASHKIRTIPHF